MALSPPQVADATRIYGLAVQRGLPPQRARELVLAAFHEGGLNPDAVNPESGAAGDFQLLSPGYRARAQQLGGVHDTAANLGAILPDYQRFWQQHPDAPVGAAAAAVERSGKGADYYGAGGDLLGFLGGKGATGAPPATMGHPVGPAPLAPGGQDPRTAFALTIAQNIGKHNGLDPDVLAGALQTLHASQAQAEPPRPAAMPAPTVEPANAAPGVVGRVAASFLGVPYKWGGTNPKSGLDCSAFLQQVMGRMGVKIPRTTYDQVKHGQPIGLHELQAGDAIFTEPGHAGPNHVGLYVGNGMVQESPHTGDVNKLIPLKDFLSGGFVAARRYLGQPV